MSEELYQNDIAILLATHNGECFLRPQLESIAAQTHPFWHLLVQDDSSTDETLSIINEFANRYPDKTTILPVGHFGSAKANFSSLLEQCPAQFRYMAFCDQDDIWLASKLERSIDALKRAEKNLGDIPVLVHSDLTLVNEYCELISPSMFHYQKLDPRFGNSLHRISMQNVVTGCTVLFNAALRDLSSPVPADAIIHDWWLAQCAAAYGKIIFLNESTILYRQHGTNTIGARKYSALSAFKHFLAGTGTLKQSICGVSLQAGGFYLRFASRMDKKQHRQIAAIASLSSMKKPARILCIFLNDLRLVGFLRNLGLIVGG